MRKYKMVKAHDVDDYLLAGWELWGSPVQIGSSRWNVYQAVVMRKEEEG